MLKLTSSALCLYKYPTSGGKHPDKLVLISSSSSKVLAELAMLGGKKPPKLLLANTKTDAKLKPIFDKMTEVKRLL